MTRALLFLALAGIGSAQQFAGGGVDGDTQSREVVPLFSRPVGDESRLVGCDGDIQKNQPNKGNERAGGTFPLRPQAQMGLPTINGSAGSTPARLHQHQHRVHYRDDAQGREWGWLDCNDFGGGIMGPASERTAGLPTRKVRPATASAPYWRGQYRCTMRTRIDDKGREWQGEECYWFAGAAQLAPAGAVTRVARPASAGWWKRHLADTALHLTATSADAASSWGRYELNPVLRSADGRFGAKGVAIKGAFALAVEVVKWRLAKRHPRERWVRALSLGPAAAFGGVAVRNWSVR